MRTLRLLLLAWLALALSVPAMARDWFRTQLPGLVVYSDGYPQELERWTRKIAMFDRLLSSRYGGGSQSPGSALTIYLLEDEEAVSRLAGTNNLTGFYSSSSEGSFAIASRRPGYDREKLSGQMALFHEYTHHFMYRHFTNAYPAWYREGFADYASTASFDDEWRSTFGEPAYARLKDLRKAPLPIETILFSSVDEIATRDRSRFYAWSWKLVHMLNSRSDLKRKLDSYLALFARGTAPEKAALAAFGNLDRLENDLRAYQPVEGQTLPTKSLYDDGFKLTVVALGAAHSSLVDLHLARRMNSQPDRTMAALRALAAVHPRDADIQLELALAERALALTSSAIDFTAAEVSARRAQALAPQNVRAVAILTDLALRRMKRDPASPRSEWLAVRRKLADAITRKPHDPLALTIYFRSFILDSRQPSEEAHDAMAAAFAMQPESYEIRLSRIISLALQHRFDQARSLAQVMASDPHAAFFGQKALASIARMEALAQRRGIPRSEEISDGTELLLQ